MLDLFDRSRAGATALAQQWFYGDGVWHPYELPRGCSQVFMFGIGAGGGGGGGLSGSLGTQRGGGGSGGSGAIMRCLFPRWSLPDVIYVQGGSGVGSGGAGGSGGTAGNPTYVAAQPNTSALYLYLLANAGGGGGAGLSSGAAAGGTAGAVTTAANCQLISAANWVSIAGQAGITGGTTSNGSFITWGNGGISISGGGSGAGVGASNNTLNGGGITGAGLFPTLNGVTAAPGSDGVIFWKPFMTCGGVGGGANGASGQSGSNGGRGQFGSGGGGGGGGTVAGGAGGDGGNGLVLIVCW